MFFSSRFHSVIVAAAQTLRRHNVHIRRQIELFLQKSGMAPTLFGRLVAKDPRLVHDIRNGREPRRSMVDKIRIFIESRTDSGERGRALS